MALMRAVLGVALANLLSGCGANFKEEHFFATYSGQNSVEPKNFFRLKVTGKTSFSNARYVAGYYDERAVDLFFNEVKPTSTQHVFLADQKEPGTEDNVKPLTPADGRGRFVMILSTNADSIANTIGAMSENQAAMEALNNLVNKSQIEHIQQSAAETPGHKASAAATVRQLTSLSNSLADDSDVTTANGSVLGILNELARAAGHPVSFASIGDAESWFMRQEASP
ncbi:MAG: hypothetical protein HYV17_15580 [Xanthomonadales bacterium]|nr:hypothetical protein [Xanthomonadales bacterium]